MINKLNDICKQYSYILTELDYEVAKQSITYNGFDVWFDRQLNSCLNCTKTFKNGQRIVSTKSNQYGKEIHLTMIMIKEFGDTFMSDKNADYYYNQLYEHHLKMIEFEINNPDTYVQTKSSKKKSATRKHKQLSMDLGEKFNKSSKKKIANFPKIIIKIPGL